MALKITRQDDFELTYQNIEKFGSAMWNRMERVGGEKTYATMFKILYSDSGLYFLICCEDKKISSTMQKDGDDLYTEDVLEIFLQPDPEHPVYLEYEISPLNKELVLMVSHNGENFYGWLPFHYYGARKAEHIIWCGEEESGEQNCRLIWRAMIYIPFALLEGVMPERPSAGTVWKGNLYRIDYDEDDVSRYAFRTECGTDFHDYKKFEDLIFE